MTGKERTGQLELLTSSTHDSWFMTLFFAASLPVFAGVVVVVVVEVVVSPSHPGLVVILFIAQ